MLKHKKYLLVSFYICCFLISQVNGQSTLSENWVDSVFHTMTMDEKIGQMLMIRAFSKGDKEEEKRIKDLITKEKVGGICFFQGTPTEQVELTNKYQDVSNIPLMIAIDGEFGLGMRHPKYTITYPRQLMLGAIQDNNLIYEMGKDIGAQCLRLGINVNFAPVVDVNNNINNPVINDRSFGEDKINVAAKSYAYMQGLQEAGVLASAKHFPGHGDTEVDSHYDLPVINHSLERLNDIELFPFKSMINLGIGSIMVAHLHIPVLDDRKNRATTLSRKTVTNLLREDLSFNGIIFTDAMEMKGVTKHFNPGEADAEAILAGNDIVLLPLDVVKAKTAIKNYLKEGKITQQQINESVLRILNAKYNFHISSYKTLPTTNLETELNQPKYIALRTKLVENALTLASNSDDIVPIRGVNQNLISIAIGSNTKTTFQKRISDYNECQHLTLSKNISDSEIAKTIYRTKGKDLVIISLHDLDRGPKTNFGISNSALKLINKINETKKVILVIFGNPYALKNFDDLNNIIVAYEDTKMTQDITAQSLFGANPFLGKLPVTSSSKYYVGKGITTPSLGRLGFSIPERVGLNSDTLSSIEKVVDTIINTRAAPGCQILIARSGKIVYQRSFGHFKYDNLKAVENSDIYDIASITKVMASTLAVMKLTDESKLDISLPLNTYLPQADTSNKKDITIEAMMAHHGRLKPWIPFYASTVETSRRKSKLMDKYYSKRLRDSFEIPVAENLFLRTDYRDSIWSKILSSDLREDEGYRYSDLGFYLTAFCVENKCLMSLDRYVDAEFYKPLGLRKTGFNPLKRIPKEEIAPTEKDNYFRNQLLQGEVHDMGAAMLGGVSGHAGLFSNTYELSILSQMLLNGGTYGGKTFLRPETIEKFTKRFNNSTRRGIGFDMKELDKNQKENLSELASDKAFGHYGFTGTAIFIDPVYDLIYIFLSNRTYPSMNNNKLNKYNYRSKIQTIAYKAIENRS